MNSAIQPLLDQNEISKMITRMSIGLDERDYDKFRSFWADQIELDVPAMSEGGQPIAQGVVDADAYAHGVIDMLSGFDATQHVSSNHLIDVDGDNAQCTCYVYATHYLKTEHGDPWHVIGARYDMQATRTPKGWKVSKLQWRKMFSQGNPALWGEIANRHNRQG